MIFTDDSSLTGSHFTTKTKKEKSIWGSKCPHWGTISASTSQISMLTRAIHQLYRSLQGWGNHTRTGKEVKARKEIYTLPPLPLMREFNTYPSGSWWETTQGGSTITQKYSCVLICVCTQTQMTGNKYYNQILLHTPIYILYISNLIKNLASQLYHWVWW